MKALRHAFYLPILPFDVPWIQIITGSLSPLFAPLGAHTLTVRQSTELRQNLVQPAFTTGKYLHLESVQAKA